MESGAFLGEGFDLLNAAGDDAKAEVEVVEEALAFFLTHCREILEGGGKGGFDGSEGGFTRELWHIELEQPRNAEKIGGVGAEGAIQGIRESGKGGLNLQGQILINSGFSSGAAGGLKGDADVGASAGDHGEDLLAERGLERGEIAREVEVDIRLLAVNGGDLDAREGVGGRVFAAAKASHGLHEERLLERGGGRLKDEEWKR